MKPTLIAVLCICCAFTGFSQSPFNLLPGTENLKAYWPVVIANKLAFFAEDTANNPELYSYDGTNPAAKVYELNPNGPGAYPPGTVLNNILYFRGDDGTTGSEIYKWDGANKPVLTTDLSYGTSGNVNSYPYNLVTLNNKLYCNAIDTGGHEIWEYDPANNTAKKLTNIEPNGNSHISRILAFKYKLYFTGYSYPPNDSLWLYQYTTASAKLKKINNAAGSIQMHVFGNELYSIRFLQYKGVCGELCSFDGYNQPQQLTHIGSDFNSGVKAYIKGGSDRDYIIYYKDKIYFFGREKLNDNFALMSYDINAKNTSTVHDFGTQNDSAEMMIVYHDKLYFTAKDKQYSNVNYYLFSYDGTGTPAIVDKRLKNPGYPVIYNDALYISGTKSGGGIDTPGIYFYHDNTSINDVAVIDNATLYPNPTTGNATLEFTLQSGQQLSLAITDITGRNIFTLPAKIYQAGSNKIEIPAKALSNGIYNCRVVTINNELIWSGKLLKE